jgi:hypothetical protein
MTCLVQQLKAEDWLEQIYLVLGDWKTLREALATRAVE